MKIQSIEKHIPNDEKQEESCEKTSICKEIGLADKCSWVQKISEDLTKPGILIIDDNPGITSFLEDDLYDLDSEGKININDYNIFTFTTKKSGFEFLATMRKHGDLNIQYAIIDITLGSVINSANKIIKITGVDVFEILNEVNPNLKYFFYTGNRMNYNIKHIGEIMDNYYKITKENILDRTLFKTELNIKDRQKYIYEKFFKS